MPLITALLRFAEGLRFKQLFLLTGALFIVDLAVPDFIPFVDELMLGLLTLLFAAWRKKPEERLAAPADDAGPEADRPGSDKDAG
jgi:hypothetical protein